MCKIEGQFQFVHVQAVGLGTHWHSHSQSHLTLTRLHPAHSLTYSLIHSTGFSNIKVADAMLNEPLTRRHQCKRAANARRLDVIFLWGYILADHLSVSPSLLLYRLFVCVCCIACLPLLITSGIVAIF